ncbi:hypothetical protein FHS85_000940 [Rhodoligotrophos appendicifer]|uniref:hypothetical protein n=1 Tax=Rhodoligotrophos appendicifer TaxID=987056 RepID=UPI001180EC1C|nr:hypothetical protein [Rhodoligotrophos appendicifer]
MTSILPEIWAVGVTWIVLVLLVARMTQRSPLGSVGLPIAFLLSMSFLYCGFASYGVPGYSHMRPDGRLYLQSYGFTEETVLVGAKASLLGVFGFALGCWVSERRALRHARQPVRRASFSPSANRELMMVLGAFGLAGFLAAGTSLPIPMLQAVLQVGRNVAVVAICLGAVIAALSGRSTGRWMALACVIPMTYLVAFGFTSYGFIVLTIFLGFWLCNFVPRRWGELRLTAGAAIGGYGLLSLFVTWMSFRDQLRAVLWSDAGLFARLGAVADAVARSEFLSPWNFASLDQINGRLNQYIFVGKMIEWHAQVPGLRLYGETLYLALLAWMPRFLWPGKPEMGGSQFVAEHTGMRFSERATFGAGPVFEFYVNFGHAGVLLGFFALGLFIHFVDKKAALGLREWRPMSFAGWFAAGMAFIAPLTDFFFMVNTAVISAALIWAISQFLQSGHAPRRRDAARGKMTGARHR